MASNSPIVEFIVSALHNLLDASISIEHCEEMVSIAKELASVVNKKRDR